MTLAPLTALLIAVATLGFEALIFGNDLVEGSIIPMVDSPDCSQTQQGDAGFWASLFGSDGALATIACWVKAFGVGVVNTFLLVASVVRFFYNALTFNVPGAPAIARVLISTLFVGSIGLMMAGLFRGTKA